MSGTDADNFLALERRVSGLEDANQLGAIAPLLIDASRKALYDDWERDHWVALAKLLRDHQYFGYARRLLGRVRHDGGDTEKLRQQHALCTYKDMELPTAPRLEAALKILGEGDPPETSRDAETLGIAGAICKRKWVLEARRDDLEKALWYYERGFAQREHPEWAYAGINAAFASDQLARLEKDAGNADGAARFGERAYEIRTEIVRERPDEEEKEDKEERDEWVHATLGEAFFGLGRFEEASEEFAKEAGRRRPLWKQETTAMQLAELARVRKFENPADAERALEALLGDSSDAVRRAYTGKIGLALSGGGFRASLFHIGVLARLAEHNVLRRVEVLSCVSGGSIVGAYYYLKLRRLLQTEPDHKIDDADYVKLVDELAREFLAGVQQDLRGRLTESIADDWRMLSSQYSRTDRVAALLQDMFFARVENDAREDRAGPWRMTDLFVAPKGREADFALRYENWLRRAKVPMLVLNATTLNTGHSWQFTASWMGEPPSSSPEPVDSVARLRRMYYSDAPQAHRELPLGKAVAASACVPGLFPPISLEQLYGDLDVELVDGGVHDNQGIASLLEQDCTVLLVSDASGQIKDEEDAPRHVLGVGKRSNTILMSRVRGSQFSELSSREKAGTLRGLMVVHLKKRLWSAPHDWTGCKEKYVRDDDILAPPVDAVPKYGIDEDIQLALAELRTDLDVFSDEEAYALMAAGYAMVGVELAKALPEHAHVGARLKGVVTWPFASAFPNAGEQAQRMRLLDSLRAGSARFGRRVREWRLRRARKPKGRVRRLLDSAHVSAAPRAVARAAKAGVVSPVRKAVSAPVAVAAGLGTRLSRRARQTVDRLRNRS